MYSTHSNYECVAMDMQQWVCLSTRKSDSITPTGAFPSPFVPFWAQGEGHPLRHYS